jgi:phosphate-selective porin
MVLLPRTPRAFAPSLVVFSTAIAGLLRTSPALGQPLDPLAPSPSPSSTAPIPAPPVAPVPGTLPATSPDANAAAPAPSAVAPSPAPIFITPSLPPRPADPYAPRGGGYHNGNFYVRSQDDVFRLYIQGRVHADWLGQFAPGGGQLAPGSNLANGFYMRRARLELGGEFFQTWQWQLGAEFSSATSIDNAAGQQTTPTCAPNSTGAAPCTNKENPVENATVKPIPTDVFVNYGPSSYANIQVGQFYLPFTLENRISDNTTVFLERSLAVRNIGAPLQRDIGAMVWGETKDRQLYYAVALVNGDGPNRLNVDSRYDVAGRVVVRPFALWSSPTKWAQIGVSAKAGSRQSSAVGYDLPNLTTQGGFAFWKPTYKDSLGRTTHIMPAAGQWGLAADLYVPIENFDLTGEFIYNVYDTREAIDGYQISSFTERAGLLKGYGWYVQAGYWLVGDHDILGPPSYGRPIHVDFTKPQNPARHGLQVVAKFEQLALTYQGAERAGTNDAKTPNGDIRVEDVEFGINYWATKHLRVGVNYTHYMFPSAAPATASAKGEPVQQSSQRAISPAQNLAAGADDAARNGSGTLEEVQVRVGVQF